jgi:membrane-associated protein
LTTYAQQVRSAAEHHILAFGHLQTAGPVMVWVIVLAFVFVECAFVIGLFLPGDSLLFTAGVVLSQRDSALSAIALSAAAVVVAVIGNQIGYYIGRQTGTTLVGRTGAKVLTHERLARATKFLDRHGWWSVVLARWIPWIRTLAPLIAGAARMDARRYMASTAVGAALWVPVLVLAGYYGAGLLDQFPWVKTAALIVSVGFFVVGTVFGVWRYRQEVRRTTTNPLEPAEVGADSGR